MRHPLSFLATLLILIGACSTDASLAGKGDVSDTLIMTSDTAHHKHTNRLIDETSPYLLQHARNPVDWYPWGDEALAKAKAEDKMILVSVGYSACHWCHVMERECFEDEEVANLMNKHFVCVKVDREERPDVDQIYMSAVQLMNQRGGWPLNCFTLPDGRPVYGGTYFPKASWMQILSELQRVYTTDRAKMEEYATALTEGVQKSELVPRIEDKEFEIDQLSKTVDTWSAQFDRVEGGPNRAPKFPIPNNYQFLLQYYHLTGDESIGKQVELTLDKMAFGGIYDQIGGGFARYSTDELWKAPHFEKMLYDNAQLVSLYSEAYQSTGKELYKEVVYESLDFVERELTSSEGAFYSALDADSEGEEGKFYVWKKDELKDILGVDFDFVKDYYNLNSDGLWEHGNYILLRRESDQDFGVKHKLTQKQIRTNVLRVREKLMKVREGRIRPGLDDKSLTSWNALMLKGYADAYLTFGEARFLDAALKNANFILKKQLRGDGGLNHSYKEGRSTINGYLEDYCFTIEAFIRLYEATFDEAWLNKARDLANYTLGHFKDEESGMFFFTSDVDAPLIARKTEVNDNVIPASCSSLAKGFFLLGHYFENQAFTDYSRQMLRNIYDQIPQYGAGYSNWGILLLWETYPFYEVALVGKEVASVRAELTTHYQPNKLLIGARGKSDLPLLEGKLIDGQTTIYVCENQVCQLPVTEVGVALKQMSE